MPSSSSKTALQTAVLVLARGILNLLAFTAASGEPRRHLVGGGETELSFKTGSKACEPQGVKVGVLLRKAEIRSTFWE